FRQPRDHAGRAVGVASRRTANRARRTRNEIGLCRAACVVCDGSGGRGPGLMDVLQLRGRRVLLRGWEPRDARPFATLNADPTVREHFPSALTRAESDAMITRLQSSLEQRGWGSWCLEIEGECAGFVGLAVPTFEAKFTPCVEVGWRLAASAWGKGYATEAARLALNHGFKSVGLSEIVSFTTVAHWRSRRGGGGAGGGGG